MSNGPRKFFSAYPSASYHFLFFCFFCFIYTHSTKYEFSTEKKFSISKRIELEIFFKEHPELLLWVYFWFAFNFCCCTQIHYLTPTKDLDVFCIAAELFWCSLCAIVFTSCRFCELKGWFWGKIISPSVTLGNDLFNFLILWIS